MGRESGVLLHVTSLPGEEGIGTLGEEAHRFLRFLHSSGQGLWQMLPVHPTYRGDSPFQGPSVFAGNANLIDLRSLVEAGDLDGADREAYLKRWRAYKAAYPGRRDEYVEYGFIWERKLGFDSRVSGYRDTPLRRAHVGFKTRDDAERVAAYEDFCLRNEPWLDDFALFMALKDTYGFDVLWPRWQPEDAGRSDGFRGEIDADEIQFHRYVQFVFDEQMRELREEAKRLGIKLVGDMAIYPGFDSADVWSGRDLFQLDAEGYPTFVAAVPPDFFSDHGQLWGNPLYRWGGSGTDEEHAAVYRWWAKRIARELEYFDLVKIDHFRAFDSFGVVNVAARSAAGAWWMTGPGREAIDAIAAELGGDLPLIAEDLGIVSEGVLALLEETGLPGMRVLAFADWKTGDPRENDSHPYLPHNIPPDCDTVFYTGTHDNATLRQRLGEIMTDAERANLERYVAGSQEETLWWRVVDTVSASHARRVVFPVQDLLGLGREARMNDPALAFGCWRWRLTQSWMAELEGDCAGTLLRVTERSGRTSRGRSSA